MKQNQTERNIEFDEQPSNYEVGEFTITRNGILDRRALYMARAERIGGIMSKAAQTGAVAVLRGVVDVMEVFAEAGREEDQRMGMPWAVDK